MPVLQDMIPDVEVFLSLEPEDLAMYVLEAAKTNRQNGLANMGNVSLAAGGPGNMNPYAGRERDVDLAIAEAWDWLRVQGPLVPAPGINGTNGWCVISRRGQRITAPDDFARFRAAAQF